MDGAGAFKQGSHPAIQGVLPELHQLYRRGAGSLSRHWSPALVPAVLGGAAAIHDAIKTPNPSDTAPAAIGGALRGAGGAAGMLGGSALGSILGLVGGSALATVGGPGLRRLGMKLNRSHPRGWTVGGQILKRLGKGLHSGPVEARLSEGAGLAGLIGGAFGGGYAGHAAGKGVGNLVTDFHRQEPRRVPESGKTAADLSKQAEVLRELGKIASLIPAPRRVAIKTGWDNSDSAMTGGAGLAVAGLGANAAGNSIGAALGKGSGKNPSGILGAIMAHATHLDNTDPVLANVLNHIARKNPLTEADLTKPGIVNPRHIPPPSPGRMAYNLESNYYKYLGGANAGVSKILDKLGPFAAVGDRLKRVGRYGMLGGLGLSGLGMLSTRGWGTNKAQGAVKQAKVLRELGKIASLIPAPRRVAIKTVITHLKQGQSLESALRVAYPAKTATERLKLAREIEVAAQKGMDGNDIAIYGGSAAALGGLGYGRAAQGVQNSIMNQSNSLRRQAEKLNDKINEWPKPGWNHPVRAELGVLRDRSFQAFSKAHKAIPHIRGGRIVGAVGAGTGLLGALRQLLQDRATAKTQALSPKTAQAKQASWLRSLARLPGQMVRGARNLQRETIVPRFRDAPLAHAVPSQYQHLPVGSSVPGEAPISRAFGSVPTPRVPTSRDHAIGYGLLGVGGLGVPLLGQVKQSGLMDGQPMAPRPRQYMRPPQHAARSASPLAGMASSRFLGRGLLGGLLGLTGYGLYNAASRFLANTGAAAAPGRINAALSPPGTNQ